MSVHGSPRPLSESESRMVGLFVESHEYPKKHWLEKVKMDSKTFVGYNILLDSQEPLIWSQDP